MCMHNATQQKQEKKPADEAKDVPLGDGLADAAKRSILSRRERIERALAAAEGVAPLEVRNNLSRARNRFGSSKRGTGERALARDDLSVALRAKIQAGFNILDIDDAGA